VCCRYFRRILIRNARHKISWNLPIIKARLNSQA
jgi:hypothetical protein